MRVSSSTCREQQAIQKRIAKNDPLENRRTIATAAATAWGKEAAEADKREAREVKRRAQIALEASAQTPSAAEQIAYALIGMMVLAGLWLIVAFRRNQQAKIDKYRSDNRLDR